MTARSVSPILCAILLACTAAVFLPARQFKFVDWDDYDELTENPLLHPPTADHLRQIWSGPYLELYAPLTYTTWWALIQVSPEPYAFHLLNVSLHLAGVAFVFSILRLCLKSPVAAFGGAAIFALHPMQVETVAWVAEMNNLLAAALSLAAIRVYLASSTSSAKRQWILYAIASLLFALALLSKPIAVMTPVIAIILDAGMLRRPWRNSLAKLLPWFVAAAVFGWIAHRVQRGFWTPPLDRPIVALDALSFYCQKILWPVGLTIDYGRTPARLMAGHQWILNCAVILALAATIWFLRRLYRGVAIGSLIALAALLPVLGLVPFSFQEFSSVADRFIYLAMLGPALAVASLLATWPWRAALGISLALGVTLAILSGAQLSTWQDSTTLAIHTLQIDPGSAVGNDIAGAQLNRDGHPREAAPRFSLAILRDPTEANFHYDLGNTLLRLQQYPQAINEYLAAIRNSQHPLTKAMNNLGVAYIAIGHPADAAAEFQKILEIEPGNAQAAQNLRILQTGVPSR